MWKDVIYYQQLFKILKWSETTIKKLLLAVVNSCNINNRAIEISIFIIKIKVIIKQKVTPFIKEEEKFTIQESALLT